MSRSLAETPRGRPGLSAPGNRVAVRALWLAIARLGSQALMVVFTGLVARRLGSAGLGEYAFLAALLMVANTLSTFGTDTLVIRRLVSESDFSLLTSALVVQLGLSVLLIGLAFAWHAEGPAPSVEARAAWRAFALALLPLAFYGVFSAALRAFERMAAYMWLSLGGAFLQTLGVALALRPSSNVLTLAYLLLATQIAAAVLAAWLCWSQIPGFRLPRRASWAAISSVIVAGWPLAALAVLMMLYQRLGVVMLGLIGAGTATGWYAAALRVVEASKVAHNSLSGALLPALGRAAGRSAAPGATATSQRALRVSWRAIMGFSVAASTALTLFAGPLSRILFGVGFGPTADALRVIAWALIPFTLNAYFSLTHVAAGTERPALVAVGVGILVMAVLSLLWIPRWGVMGASWSMLIAEWAQAGAYLLNWRRGRASLPLAASPSEI